MLPHYDQAVSGSYHKGMDGGVYIAIFYLASGRAISTGSLGKTAFAAGLYLYVGSAQRNLSHRLARHARQDKPLRWHIDYLARHAHMVGAVVIRGGKELECRLAARLAKQYRCPVARFGASDCKCPGHLFHVPMR